MVGFGGISQWDLFPPIAYVIIKSQYFICKSSFIYTIKIHVSTNVLFGNAQMSGYVRTRYGDGTAISYT